MAGIRGWILTGMSLNWPDRGDDAAEVESMTFVYSNI